MQELRGSSQCIAPTHVSQRILVSRIHGHVSLHADSMEPSPETCAQRQCKCLRWSSRGQSCHMMQVKVSLSAQALPKDSDTWAKLAISIGEQARPGCVHVLALGICRVQVQQVQQLSVTFAPTCSVAARVVASHWCFLEHAHAGCQIRLSSPGNARPRTRGPQIGDRKACHAC